MAELSINAKITGSLKIGSNPPSRSNELKLEITNHGEEVLQGRKILYFYLTGTLGSSAEDLFLDQTETTNCEPNYPSSDWQGTWTCRSNTFSLAIYTSSESILKASETLTIMLPRLITTTGPGQAKLRFGFGFGKDPVKDCGELLVDKIPDKKEIIAFYSDPPAESLILPGQSVTLKWRTNGLTDLKLVQSGKSTRPLPIGDDFDEGTYQVDNISTSVTFTLTGEPFDKQDLSIEVLTPGWKEQKNSISSGDPGFPKPANKQEAAALKKKRIFALEATQLFNANDLLLYGLFRYTYKEKEIAFLASADNPFARWSTLESQVPDQEGWIPMGFATSPGVYFKDHLWLIGGSQIDPDNTSNIVWRLDPRKMVWQSMGAVGWPARMGHAVLVFKDKIWVMGGRDSSGNPLNDIWTSDGDPSNWRSVPQTAPPWWAPRCLFYPTVWNDRIWLFGGMSEPFSSKLFKDLWVSSASGEAWQLRNLTGVLNKNDSHGPVASCLEVFKRRLVLLGKFLNIDPKDKSEKVETMVSSLSAKSTDTWADFPDDGLKGWGSTNTSSFQMINFRDEILVGKALAHDQPNQGLKIYIPQS